MRRYTCADVEFSDQELIRSSFDEFVFRSEVYAVLSVSTTATNPVRFQNLVVARAWV
jgi:hypothetical protein